MGSKITRLKARLRAQIRRRARVSSVQSTPRDPRAWIKLSREKFDQLPAQTKVLLDRHELHPDSGTVAVFKDYIETEGGPALERLAVDPNPAAIAQAINEIIRWLTVAQCAHAHQEGLYYAHAEPHMARQWERTIWPIIKDEDFTSTLELACGHGRNTEFLRRFAKSIDLIDVNQNCINACRERFGWQQDGCTFRYHVTSGNRLPVDSSSISFGYSWDSMVHFDKLVVRDYVFEFARVLKPSASAFLHHSNYGTVAPDSSWTKNHGNRSDMTAELMREYVKEAGLAIKFQRLSGRADGWGLDDLDCLTLLYKPAAA